MQKDNVFVDKFFYGDEIKKMKKPEKAKKKQKSEKPKEGADNGNKRDIY